MRFRRPLLHFGWSSSDHQTTQPKGRQTQLQRSQQGRRVQNLVMLSLVLSTVYAQGTRYGGEEFSMPRSKRLRHDLTQSECPLRNINTRSPQLSQIHCCATQHNLYTTYRVRWRAVLHATFQMIETHNKKKTVEEKSDAVTLCFWNFQMFSTSVDKFNKCPMTLNPNSKCPTKYAQIDHVFELSTRNPGTHVEYWRCS